MNDTRVSHITYHLLLVLVAFLWGTNVIVMKWGFNYFSPEQFNLLRIILAFPFLVYLSFFLPGHKRYAKRDLLHVVFIGAIGMGLFQVLYPLGLYYTSAPVGGILLATMPVQVVIISLLFRIERPSGIAIAGVLLTIVGLAIITLSSRESRNPGETTVLGVMFLILAEAGFAIYSTFLRTYMKKYTTLQVAGTAIGVSALVYAAIYFPELGRVNYRLLPAEGWLLVIYSGIAPLVLGNLLWNYSIKHIGSTRASVYGNLPPFFVLLLSALLLGELLNVIQLVGGIVTILGVIIAQLRKPVPISTGD